MEPLGRNYHPKIMIFENNQNKNVALECKESVRYLGVIIDNNLSWKHYIDHVAIKINQTQGTAFSSMTYSLNHL